MYFSIKTASGVQVFRYNLTQIERKIMPLYDYLCIMHHYINLIQLLKDERGSFKLRRVVKITMFSQVIYTYNVCTHMMLDLL